MTMRAGRLSADWKGMPSGAIASAVQRVVDAVDARVGIATPCSMPVEAIFSAGGEGAVDRFPLVGLQPSLGDEQVDELA